MKKKLFILFLFLLSFLAFTGKQALAQDLDVTCDNNSCSLSSNDPLFSEINIYPGWSTTKIVKGINNYDQDLNFVVEVIDPFTTDTTSSLADVITVTITEQESNTIVYGPKTINQWLNDGFVSLSNIPEGNGKNYDFVISLDNINNDYQDKELIFDLNLGFEALPVVTGDDGDDDVDGIGGGTDASPSPSPTLTPSPSPATGEVAGATAIQSPSPSPSTSPEGKVKGAKTTPSWLWFLLLIPFGWLLFLFYRRRIR
ncbi:MAG: BatA domain-containing protein [Candidatus Beckwithbacteria bacterium]|nr:BatA domain-containing protein [Patescibacteria group bacterium]